MLPSEAKFIPPALSLSRHLIREDGGIINVLEAGAVTGNSASLQFRDSYRLLLFSKNCGSRDGGFQCAIMSVDGLSGLLAAAE